MTPHGYRGNIEPDQVSVLEIEVADPPRSWAAAGFAVDDQHTIVCGRTRIVVREPERERRGILGWRLEGITSSELDGLPTQIGPATRGSLESAATVHPNGVVGIDHVVIATPDLDRTVAAFEAGGLELRRTREAGTERRPLVQAFLRADDVIIEVVGPPEPASRAPATFFGLAFVVDDLDLTAVALAGALGPVRDAVQPNRRIATLDHRSVGVSVRCAFMSADPRRSPRR